MKISYFIKTFALLLAVVLVFGAAMFGLNFVTGPNIEANNDRIAELKVKDDDKVAEPEVVAEAEAVVTAAPAEEIPAVEEATSEDFADEAPKTEE